MQASGVLTDGMMSKRKAFEPGKVMQKRAESEHGTVEAMRATLTERTPGEPRSQKGRPLSRKRNKETAPLAGESLQYVRRQPPVTAAGLYRKSTENKDRWHRGAQHPPY